MMQTAVANRSIGTVAKSISLFNLNLLKSTSIEVDLPIFVVSFFSSSSVLCVFLPSRQKNTRIDFFLEEKKNSACLVQLNQLMVFVRCFQLWFTLKIASVVRSSVMSVSECVLFSMVRLKSKMNREHDITILFCFSNENCFFFHFFSFVLLLNSFRFDCD